MRYGEVDGFTVQPNGSVILDVGDVEGIAHQIHLTRRMLRSIAAESDGKRLGFDSEAYYLADEGRGFVTVLDRRGDPVERSIPRSEATACYTDQ